MEQLREKALEIRQMIFEMCDGAGTGHVTSGFSSVEILITLYYAGILKYDPNNPDWEERDRFILSKGQASVALYPILADVGFIPKHDLKKFCKKDGKIGVHLQHSVPGVEITAGSLGQGLGIAAGMALAAKNNRSIFRNNHMVYCLLGDAETQEGSIWESAAFASQHKLNNLAVIIDRNGLGVIDWTEDSVGLEPMADRWTAFGWDAINVHGHMFEQLIQLRRVSERKSPRPFVMIADTTKGYGLPHLENEPKWHGITPGGEEAKIARKILGL